MKLTKTALLKKEPSISGFNQETPESVYAEFAEYNYRNKGLAVLPKKYKILYADYTYENYSGDAFVLGFDKELNQFFEVNGSHCSCYGLEGQWEPEYFEDVKQMQEVFKKRFESRSKWGRYANSSVEFENWLIGDK